MKSPGDKLRISIRRPVAVAMIFLGAVVFGMNSYQELALNLMPDLSYPTITVRTEYPEAAPEEVENFVSRPLEEALGTVSSLVEIRSISSAGSSEVLLDFSWGTNMDIVSLDVREKMDRVFFPEGVARPTILRYNPALDPILRFGVYGDQDLFELRRIAEEELKPEVEGLSGVASVKVKGGLEEEVLVEVDEGRMAERGITMELLAQRLWQENINLAGGSLEEGRATYLVRTLNEFAGLGDIGEVVVGRKGGVNTYLKDLIETGGPKEEGAEVRVKDVATIHWGHKRQEVITRINKMDSVEVEIYKEADSNTVDVSDRVKAVLGLGEVRSDHKAKGHAPGVMSRLAEDYPGVHVQLISDPARFIKGAIQEVRSTAVLGGILALLVLFLFLRDLKSTLIVGVSIPVSILMTFVPMLLFDVSLNLMSLGGLALGIGMLVDNSIVVLESIFRCREEGDGVAEAADRGTGEVAAAITASTLTTIAVFFPIVFVKGIAGQLFNDLALTVTFSLLGSLLVALYLIPMMASRQMDSEGAAQVTSKGPQSITEICKSGLKSGLSWLGENGRPGRWMKESKGYLSGRRPETGDDMSDADTTNRVGGEVITVLQRLPLRAYGVVHPLFESFRFLLVFFFGVLLGAACFWLLLLFRILTPVLALAVKVLRVIFSPGLSGFERAMASLARAYGPVLNWCLQHRGLVILVGTLGLTHCLLLFPGIGTELIPRIHQGQFAVRVEYPVGTPLEVTSQAVAPIEAMVLQDSSVGTVFGEIGSELSGDVGFQEQKGESTAEITVVLKDIGGDIFEEDALMDRLREGLRDFAGIQSRFVLPSLFGFRTPVVIEIEGNDLQELRRIALEVERRIQAIPGLADVRASAGIGSPEVQIQFDRDRLAHFDLDVSKAARVIQKKLLGEVSTRLSEGQTRHDIRVRADRENFRDLEDLRNLKIDVGSGRSVPLASLADISVVPGPSEIRRVAQRRVAVISANLKGMDLGSVSHEIMEKLEDLELPPGYRIDLGGQNREMQASFESLRFALFLAIFLVYIVMASQFESLLHPFVILFSIPLGLIGVIYTLYLLHIPLSVVVFLGAIMLAGIMVNDAIVLVDYVNVLRKRGVPRQAAISRAGGVRLRPILMTTMTTILGLLPMALGLGEGAEIRMPMAVTVIAGLAGSTILTLLVIPVVYSLLDRKP